MAERFNYGGQAIIEGVMMRGARRLAMAVRTPAGQIEVRTEPLNAALYDGWPSRVPLVRGLLRLWDALGLGTQALLWSAEVAVGETSGGEAPEGGVLQEAAGWGAVVVGLAVGVGLFMVLPTLIVGLLPHGLSSLVVNLLEGLVRLALVLGYIWAVGRVPDVVRVFAYHGAEHKTINAYEAGAELTVGSVQAFSAAHTRCGTAFLLNVVVVSLLVLAPLGRPPLVWRIVSRIVLLPLIAGLSYELIRWSARHAHRPWLQWVIRPSMALQRMTTREPDDGMVEVAIRALEAVLAQGSADA